jgi:hypothetical protein
MQQINISELKIHPRNKEFFDDMSNEKWNEFKESIKKHGIIEPIIITPEKIIVSGHQRVKACKELGFQKIMVDMQTYKDEEDVFLNMLLSNLWRVIEIPTIAKRCAIIFEIENICNKRNQKKKEERNIIKSNLRNEISKCKNNIIDYYDGKCQICEFNLKPLLEIHHILPISQGGTNSLDNLTCLCPTCHTVMHKFISYFYNNNITNSKDINDIEIWLENNYTESAYNKILNMYKKYIRMATS